jgi:hypothetical protein
MGRDMAQLSFSPGSEPLAGITRSLFCRQYPAARRSPVFVGSP